MINFDEASQKSKEAMDSMMQQYALVTKGFQTIATEAADFTKQAFEDGVAHFEKLSGVRSIEDAVELQTAFAKSSFDKFVAEASKMGEMYAGLAKDAYKPYEAAMGAAKAPAANMADAA